MARGARRSHAGHGAPPIVGLGLTGWEDVGGLTRLEVVGLLTLAIQRLAHTPEVGAGTLFPGLLRPS